MIERLNEIEQKYEDLGTELTKPETLQDVELLTKLSKEQRKLALFQSHKLSEPMIIEVAYRKGPRIHCKIYVGDTLLMDTLGSWQFG